MSEDFTVSILANDINRDCTGQYHFRNKISKSDQKEKDEADSRLAPKFHPATTRPRLGVVPSLRGETYRTWPIALNSVSLVTGYPASRDFLSCRFFFLVFSWLHIFTATVLFPGKKTVAVKTAMKRLRNRSDKIKNLC